MNIYHTIVAVIDTNSLPKPDTTQTIQNITNIVFALIGSLALLIIVLAGLRYITARGDPNGVSQARQAILYAVIGLIVAVAAYAIVTFVVKGLA